MWVFTSLILRIISFIWFQQKSNSLNPGWHRQHVWRLGRPTGCDARLIPRPNLFSNKVLSPLTRLVVSWCKKKTLPRLNAGCLKSVCLSVSPLDREAQSYCSFKRKKREDESNTRKTKHIHCLKGRLEWWINRNRTDEAAERIYKSTRKGGPLSESI